MSRVLIIGAKSDIAQAVAREYAKHGYGLYLAARKSNELEGFARDIAVRTQQPVKTMEIDILDYGSHQSFYDQLKEKPIGVVCAVGYLGTQSIAQDDFKESKLIVDTNFTGIVSLLNIVANDFEKRSTGFIVGISSVAGDRGRKSNYVYGSAKAALTTYLSGLRNRLYDYQVHVMTVKPGFVATKMTEHMPLPGILTAQPEQVAADIYKAQQKKRDVLYTKWYWKWIMLVIRLIPEWIFKRMNLLRASP
ncbi:SDR family oxidoreductase [Thiolapillus brandeum]|uniref:Short-chain dehydrogenase/reductase SDR n=1 Tax=Thiolapillus brandeum TaxID=1076588 RepID=A0A7U6GKL0_9GAMM|nr:SDR family oxidoreductase [Thiolapillus brandeum]BAO45319.1 short-chain dehydrogenase/reductase SDR [Thiolapillus brandeum]